MLLTECALAVEVSDDLQTVSVGAAGDLNALPTVALAERLPRTADVVAAVQAIRAERNVVAVVVYPYGNASNRVRPLRDAGIEVVEPTGADERAAHVEFLDRIASGTLRVIPCPELDAAIRGGVERRVGFARAWDRRAGGVDGVDGSPAWAVELALWGWLNAPRQHFFATWR